MISIPDYNKYTPDEAIALQHQMRSNINVEPYQKPITLIGGADVSFNKYEETVYAGIIVLSYPHMTPVAQATVVTTTRFPYISGLLAFREVPAVLQAWNALAIKPDVLVLDGQGIAHERRTGIATHFGMLANVPTIGCAKSRLTGTYVQPENIPFAETLLMHKNEQVGVVLQTKRNCKPIFISPGYKISMAQSLSIIKNCVRGYRIPEPTRLAHLLVNERRIKDKAATANTSSSSLFGFL